MNRYLKYINPGYKTRCLIPESRIDEVPQQFPKMHHVCPRVNAAAVLITCSGRDGEGTRTVRNEGIPISTRQALRGGTWWVTSRTVNRET